MSLKNAIGEVGIPSLAYFGFELPFLSKEVRMPDQTIDYSKIRRFLDLTKRLLGLVLLVLELIRKGVPTTSVSLALKNLLMDFHR